METLAPRCSKICPNWFKNRSGRRLGRECVYKLKFWSILDPKNQKKCSQNRPNLVQKSIQERSWKRLRIQTDFWIEFGSILKRFWLRKLSKIIKKSIQNRCLHSTSFFDQFFIQKFVLHQDLELAKSIKTNWFFNILAYSTCLK